MPLAPVVMRFFSFYSFKGGVGRSMALYNCACVLAGTGRRVLMIDFDLEAPGLTFLLQRRRQDSPRIHGTAARRRLSSPPRTPGIVEMVAGFVEDPREWPLADPRHPERIMEYVADLPIPAGVQVDGAKGRLSLIPAGRFDDTFENRLGHIRWDAKPLADLRDQLFRHIRRVIEQSGCFDYVLVDARTGFSNEGYICTRLLSDHVVVLTALNDQNVTGTARFLKQVNAWNKKDASKEKRVILIESPAPEWEEEAKAQRREEVGRTLQYEVGERIDFSLSLPYHPRMALFEETMVADWPGTSLAQAYRSLAGLLRTLSADDADRWSREVMDFMAQVREPFEGARPAPDCTKARAAIETLRSLDLRLFRQMAPMVADVVAQAEPVLLEALPLLEYLVACEPDEPVYRLRLARLLRRMASPEAIGSARAALDAAQRLQRQREDLAGLSVTLYELARLDWMQGAYDEARSGLTESRDIDRNRGDRRSEAAKLHALADLDRLQGNPEKARSGYQESLAVRRNVGDRRGMASTVAALAQLDRMQGDYEAAQAGYVEALDLCRALNDRSGMTHSLHALADLDRLRGDYGKARKGYTEAFALARSLGDQQSIAASLHGLAELDRLQGDWDAAQTRYTEALAVARASGDPRQAAVMLRGIGELEAWLGNYANARATCTEALEMLRAAGDRIGVAATLHAIASLDQAQGNLPKARKGYTESLNIARALGAQQGLGIEILALAELELLENNPKKARTVFTRAADIFRVLGAKRESALARLFLVYTDSIEQSPADIKALSAAVRTVESIGDPELLARGRLMMSEILMLSGGLKAAQEAADAALEEAKAHRYARLEAEALVMRARILAAQGNRGHANESARQAIQFFDRQSIAHPKRADLEVIAASR